MPYYASGVCEASVRTIFVNIAGSSYSKTPSRIEKKYCNSTRSARGVRNHVSEGFFISVSDILTKPILEVKEDLKIGSL